MAAQMSYRDVFVASTSTLLASGKTVDALAVGQIGILDAKTHKAVTAPTYANVKALEIVQGTPDLSDKFGPEGMPLFLGVPNQNDYSKLIKGKLLKNFQGFKATKAQNEIVTVGWSGDLADTDTLFANPGQSKRLYLTLTGGPITKKFSIQGKTKLYSTSVGSVDDASIDNRKLADDLVKQINADKEINMFVKASKLELCDPALAAATTDTDYKFKLTVCDTKDDVALGNVQAQYPNDIVKRIDVIGASSVYEIVRDANSTPAAFSNVQNTVIPNCDACPTGYTFHDVGFAYKVVREDAGDAGALTTVKSDYGIASANESGARVQYQFGSSTYILVSATELTASGTDQLEFLGDVSASCVLDTPSTVAWVANGTVVKYQKTYRITVADTVCGDSRLADLQAAYPSLTIALVAESSGTCVHTFETTVLSNRVTPGCSIEEIKFSAPQDFEGAKWVAVADAALADGTTCRVGIRLETAFVNRLTNECTFDYFAFENESVHLHASEFEPDWHGVPEPFENRWAVKKIQSYQHAQGVGSSVRKWEQEAKSYRLRERSFDPIVRENEGYQFTSDPKKFYDEYVLTFDFDYKVGGWSQSYTDSYKVHVFFEEGTGKAFETAINTYVASVGLDHISPVVL
jgi:hypothetical protein